MVDPTAAAHITATGAITVGLIAAGVAVVTSVLSTFTLRRIEARKLEYQKSRDAAERTQQISRFSEPLARSAYDLQSRIYNILRKGFIQAYLVDGNARERAYAVNNTAYLIAQNLCWTELARREIQFIDLGEDARTRKLLHLQDELYSFWGTDAQPARLRLFAGEQRALGEALIATAPDSAECIGYGQFLKTFTPKFNPLVDALRDDIAALGKDLPHASERLHNVHHALIDLLDLLDPNYLRFPLARRAKA